MNVFEALVLGIVQGFTEPIPVSSSAQTQIVAHLFKITTPGILFEVFLNFPSFLAILWMTRRDVHALCIDFFKYLKTKNKAAQVNFNIAVFVVIATLPAMFFGLAMKDIIDNYFSSMGSIAFFLSVTGVMLFSVRKREGIRDFSKMTYKDALIIGVIQALFAVIPGISRSGATIVAALFLGLNRDTSFRFSFLLYLPIGLGSMLIGAKAIFTSSHFQNSMSAYALMFIAAYFATVVGFKLFRLMVQKGQLVYFSIYCWTMAVFLITML